MDWRKEDLDRLPDLPVQVVDEAGGFEWPATGLRDRVGDIRGFSVGRLLQLALVVEVRHCTHELVGIEAPDERTGSAHVPHDRGDRDVGGDALDALRDAVHLLFEDRPHRGQRIPPGPDCARRLRGEVVDSLVSCLGTLVRGR